MKGCGSLHQKQNAGPLEDRRFDYRELAVLVAQNGPHEGGRVRIDDTCMSASDSAGPVTRTARTN
jgi:hypothetical protein